MYLRKKCDIITKIMRLKGVTMDNEKLSIEEIIAYYKPEVDKLLPYVTWLEAHKGGTVSNNYSGDGITETSIAFPVYDGTLMSFVKTAQATKLMDRNYIYAYSKNRIRTMQDEKRFIQNATIQDMGDMSCILSKYIMKGMTKASMWPEAVQYGIFLDIITKMHDLILFWSKKPYREG